MLKRLYMENSSIVIVDPTEIERKSARKTDYVGLLSDGKTRGFNLLVFSVPYKGRAIPFSFAVYSSKTINKEAISEVKEIIRDAVIMMDREFSNEEIIRSFEEKGIK